MYPVYDPQAFHNDGTPKRKYEIEEKDAKRLALRFTLTLMAFNFFILIKNVLFGADPARSFDEQRSDDEFLQHAMVVDDTFSSEPESLRANSTPEEIHEDEVLNGDSKLDRLSGSGSMPAAPTEPNEAKKSPVPADIGIRSSLNSANDNTTLYGARPGTVITAFSSGDGDSIGDGLSGGGSGGGGGSGDDVDVGDNVDDDGNVVPPPRVNRLPIVSAPIVLPGLLANTSIVIAFADLLRGAHDADGDPLAVVGLKASSGTVQVLPGNLGWIFKPDANDISAVTFSYRITDGKGTVEQVASLDLLQPDDGVIYGTEGDDRIVGTAGGDVINAQGGSDVIIGRDGDDVIYGGDGDDRILGEGGNDLIYGGGGNDTIYGGLGDDIVFGGTGNDAIFGEEGLDSLYGEDGNDLISGGDADDILDGGKGRDTLYGDAGNDIINGGDDEDVIEGGDGSDTIIGGSGSDSIAAGSGNDIVVALLGDGDDHADGGEGVDTYDASSARAMVVIDLSNGTAVGIDIGDDQIIHFENVTGGAGGDVITGNDQDNVIIAGGGNDIIIATINDGDDDYDGGDGYDTYDFSASTADTLIDVLSGYAEGDDTGYDTIDGIEQFFGGSGDDTFIAGLGHNVFSGGDGDDTFVFQSVASIGYGSGSRDQILDFAVGDRIDMHKISKEVFENIEQAFEDPIMRRFIMISSDDIFDRPGQIRFIYDVFDDRDVTILQGNIDGDADAEFEIELIGHYELRNEDFHT